MPLLTLLGTNAVGVTLGATSQIESFGSSGGITLERVIGGTSQIAAFASTGGVTLERAIGGTSQIAAFASSGGITVVTNATTITVSGITGGGDLSSLSYCVFSAAAVGDTGTTIIKQGEDELTDTNGDLTIDLTSLGVAVGATLTIVITNYTTTPTAANRAAVCYGVAA